MSRVDIRGKYKDHKFVIKDKQAKTILKKLDNVTQESNKRANKELFDDEVSSLIKELVQII